MLEDNYWQVQMADSRYIQTDSNGVDKIMDAIDECEKLVKVKTFAIDEHKKEQNVFVNIGYVYISTEYIMNIFSVGAFYRMEKLSDDENDKENGNG